MHEDTCPRRADGFYRTTRKTVVCCYSHPMRGPDEPEYEPRAHGGCTTSHVCRCGAEKLVNYSAGYAEHGPWFREENQ